MPIYEYKCENGHLFEVFQSMSDDPVTKCEECGAPVERVFHPVAVHFKGSGFYNTDYKNKGKGAAKDPDAKSGSGSARTASRTRSPRTRSRLIRSPRIRPHRLRRTRRRRAPAATRGSRRARSSGRRRSASRPPGDTRPG